MQRWFFVSMIMLVLGGLNGVPAASATDLNVRATRVWCKVLPSGATMHPGDYVGLVNSTSACGQNGRIIFQHDGNVVFYIINTSGQYTPRWSTNTTGTSANRFVMQGDGNLVLYDTANRALWNSETHGHPGAELRFFSFSFFDITAADGRTLKRIR